MRKKRRLKKIVYVVPCIIIMVVLIIIIASNYYKKINRYDYKLDKLGYTEEEVTKIKTLKEDKIDEILKKGYNKVIPKFIDQKYFIYDNLDRYIAYYEKNKSTKKEKIVSLVNVNADNAFYTNTIASDESKGNLILVNKYNYLSKNFKIDDLEDVSIMYSYGSQKIRTEAYDKFVEMFNAAKRDNITIIINSSYRTYDYQDALWKNYSKNHGEEWADSYAARAGYSEHQTGLTIDVTTDGVKEQEDFEKTDAYNWMTTNAHEYGFILRYPKDKEDITGYKYESWHYRYLGVETATKVHDSGLTYDEYYAYYLKQK